MSPFNLIISKRVAAVAPSATLTISTKAKALAQEGKNVIDMSAGEPDFNTPDFLIESAYAALKAGKTKYTAVAGIPELRQAICDKLKSENGLEYKPVEVSVGAGAKHTLYNICQAILNPGDELLIPVPGWVSYKEMATLAEAIPVEVPCTQEDGFYLHTAALEKARTPKTRALIINSPSNPTGALYSRKNLEEIAEFAVKHNVLVISDEIYEKLIYDGEKFVSIAALGPEIFARTVTVNGLSKSHSMTGWRIGYAAGPKALIDAMNVLQSHSLSNAVSFCQEASVTALRDTSDFVPRCRDIFEKRRDIIYDGITAIPGMSSCKPLGAFYLFPDISSYYGKSLDGQVINNSLDFCAHLLTSENVAAVPGSAFDSDAHMRLSYATSEANIKEAIVRIARFIARLK
jgi:aspartate aminotransferase